MELGEHKALKIDVHTQQLTQHGIAWLLLEGNFFGGIQYLRIRVMMIALEILLLLLH
jgi:hypothetical protein